MASLSAPNNRSSSSVVYVGNIPFHASEKEVMDVCQEIGPVVSFKLVKDQETGKPKGYGFCEYGDEETARSALRNLKGCWIRGRQLRVDFASSKNNNNHKRNRSSESESGASAVTSLPPSFSSSGVPEAGVLDGVSNSSSEDITKHQLLVLDLINTYSMEQLSGFLSQVSELAENDPQKALHVASFRPKIADALLHAIMLMLLGGETTQPSSSEEDETYIPLPPSKRTKLQVEDSAHQCPVS